MIPEEAQVVIYRRLCRHHRRRQGLWWLKMNLALKHAFPAGFSQFWDSTGGIWGRPVHWYCWSWRETKPSTRTTGEDQLKISSRRRLGISRLVQLQVSRRVWITPKHYHLRRGKTERLGILVQRSNTLFYSLLAAYFIQKLRNKSSCFLTTKLFPKLTGSLFLHDCFCLA